MPSKVTLEMFSDYVCPFCWLAEPAVRQLAREDKDVDVIWRAFELRPEPTPTLDPRGEYLDRVWRDSVYPLSDRLGVDLKLPTTQPRSRLAHEAASWARARGRFEEYNAALFKAFFERGEDIGRADVLTGIAGELDLNGDALGAALKRHDGESDVMADEGRAARLQISSVPAFVADNLAMLAGVQPLEKLKELIDDVREAKSARTPNPAES